MALGSTETSRPRHDEYVKPDAPSQLELVPT